MFLAPSSENRHHWEMENVSLENEISQPDIMDNFPRVQTRIIFECYNMIYPVRS